ncbi:MAG TPA: NAD(P)-binding domain-containing protein, partial [Verrucomicrobiae bacterium]|nr:NAD(P)-binding domain-containing protein [Verrucomicrobiae bacterium]
MTKDENLEVVVIGAGPAGLACGHELQRSGFRFLIVEGGSGAGESWRGMPVALKLISPWKANALPGESPFRHSRHQQLTRAEFLAYLEEYAVLHQLPVRTACPVSQVVREPGGLFAVTVPGTILRCRWLINATGYFLNPFQPHIPGAAESLIPQIHVGRYRDPGQVRSRMRSTAGPVLVVGKRLSAGQTLLELAEAGVPVALSYRSSLEFGAGRLSWWLLFRI